MSTLFFKEDHVTLQPRPEFYVFMEIKKDTYWLFSLILISQLMKNGPFRNINDILWPGMCSQMQIKCEFPEISFLETR